MHKPTTRVSSRRMLRPLLAALLFTAGCAPKKSPDPSPTVELDGVYRGVLDTDDSVAPRPMPAKFFHDPHLVALIDIALANNQELRILTAEVDVAAAEVQAIRGERRPRLDGGVGVGTEKPGHTTSQGAAEAASQIDGGPVPEPLHQLEVGLEASWEVDIWRKLRTQRDAARERYLQSVEGQRFATTVLVSELARTYYELLAIDAELAAVNDNVQLLENSLEVVRAQKEAARTTELAVQRFEAELFKVKAEAIDLMQRATITENQIQYLCGQPPGPVTRTSPESFIATDLVAPRVGVPAELLQERPDVRAAERGLAAAHLDVEAARLMFYPSLSVDASLGVEAWKLGELAVLPESLAFGASAGLLAPLLNRKTLKANHAAARAKQTQAVVAFEQTILSAWNEVVTHATRVGAMGRLVGMQASRVDRLQAAIESSSQLFGAARADYLEVLTTRRDALEARLELIQARRDQLCAVISLYQSLGGGWDRPDSHPNASEVPR